MKKPVKCMSLWQPWATLIALGKKAWETRSWSANYEGYLIIHAAKRCERECLGDEVFINALGSSCLPAGAAVAVAKVAGIYRSEEVRDQVSEEERYFGDWSPGRFVWKLEKVANEVVRAARAAWIAKKIGK